MAPIQRGYAVVAVLKYQLEAASGTVALIARTESIIPNGVDSDRLCHVPLYPYKHSLLVTLPEATLSSRNVNISWATSFRALSIGHNVDSRRFSEVTYASPLVLIF